MESLNDSARGRFPKKHAYFTQGIMPNPSGIFGVPLQVSIKYANVAISLTDNEGKSFIYGYVPIVVAKCGVFLKEQGKSEISPRDFMADKLATATEIKGIFRLSGSAKRIKELQIIFDSPTRYGKGLDWAGFTVHDAANVLRRYLNLLPEPIVPLSFYEKFRDPIRHHQREAVGNPDADDVGGFDDDEAIRRYQELITQIPPLNRQLLLYILDLLAVFASKSEINAMPSANLAAIFQPGTLSHIKHDLEPAEYRLSQDVLIFLIENQDNFLIGMRGTAADEKTVQEVQQGGTPPMSTPIGAGHYQSKPTFGRTSSNASAGAESVRKYGGVRRNVSVSSKHSSVAPSPVSASPGGNTGGIHRSNTVPSKKSPALSSTRFNRTQEPASHKVATPGTPVQALPPNEKPAVQRQPTAIEPIPHPESTASRELFTTPQAPTEGSEQIPSTTVEPPSDEKQTLDTAVLPTANDRAGEIPTRERTFGGLFSSKSLGSEGERKDPKAKNKLRKKRIPGSTNASAHSSSHSLHGPPEIPALAQSAIPQQDGASGQPLQQGAEERDVFPPPELEHLLAPAPHTLHSEFSQPNSQQTSVTDQPSKAAILDPDKSVEAGSPAHAHLAVGPQDSRALYGSVGPGVGLNQHAGISSTSFGSMGPSQKIFTNDSQHLGSETASGEPHSNPRRRRYGRGKEGTTWLAQVESSRGQGGTKGERSGARTGQESNEEQRYHHQSKSRWLC